MKYRIKVWVGAHSGKTHYTPQCSLFGWLWSNLSSRTSANSESEARLYIELDKRSRKETFIYVD